MRELEFIREHVTFKLPYDFSYHMKTPHVPMLFFYIYKKMEIFNSFCMYTGKLLYMYLY